MAALRVIEPDIGRIAYDQFEIAAAGETVICVKAKYTTMIL